MPKSPGKFRTLGIPTVADRVVQASLVLVLEPIFEADFHPSAYGFRHLRRAWDAIAEIQMFASRCQRGLLAFRVPVKIRYSQAMDLSSPPVRLGQVVKGGVQVACAGAVVSQSRVCRDDGSVAGLEEVAEVGSGLEAGDSDCLSSAGSSVVRSVMASSPVGCSG